MGGPTLGGPNVPHAVRAGGGGAIVAWPPSTEDEDEAADEPDAADLLSFGPD